MKKILLFLLLNTVLLPCMAQSDVVGKWKTIDDHNGNVQSIVSIYERDGALYGRIMRIFPEPGENPDPVCDKCAKDDPRYGQKIIGMEIMKGLKKDGNEYGGGYILDPEEGKTYRCRIWLEGEQLMVRGYWGFFYRTQAWEKAR